MDLTTTQDLIEYLSTYVTPARQRKIETLLAQRTRYVTTVLEDVSQSHNMGAILRSCEALGVQDIHYIGQNNEIKVNNAIAAGSAKWLDIIQYGTDTISPLEQCIKNLKQKGYSIVATSPHATMPLEKLSLDTKIAFLFGTEKDGLTEEAVDCADQLVALPMYGFAESFNVSVSVALTLYEVTARLRKSSISWQLSDQEKLKLKTDWMRNSAPNADALERRFFLDHPAHEEETR